MPHLDDSLIHAVIILLVAGTLEARAGASLGQHRHLLPVNLAKEQEAGGGGDHLHLHLAAWLHLDAHPTAEVQELTTVVEVQLYWGHAGGNEEEVFPY